MSCVPVYLSFQSYLRFDDCQIRVWMNFKLIAENNLVLRSLVDEALSTRDLGTRMLTVSAATKSEAKFLCLGPGLGRGRRHYAIVLRVNNRK